MLRRSPELKRILVDSINPEKIQKEHKKEVERPSTSAKEREKLRRNLEEEIERITRFEADHQALLELYSDMPEDYFNEEYEKASAELNKIIARVNRSSDEYKESRSLLLDFVDLEKIENLEQFLEAFPMQFIPRKEEIGRILALAKQMHEQRVAQGEAKPTDPIRIVDVGGANGALGKLVTDLAKENGLEIEYIVVDPDRQTVQRSAEFYKDDPSLKFRHW